MATADDYIQLQSGRWVRKDSSDARYSKAAEARSESGLTQITVNDRQLRDITQEAWHVLRSANSPPFVFQRGHLLTDIIRGDKGQPLLRTLDKAAFKGILARVADFVAETEKGSKPARPPGDVVADMMAAKELPLPFLAGIAGAPFFAPPGVLVTAPGYHPDSGFYLHLAKGLAIPEVPEKPDGRAVAEARRLLLEDLLSDFPFVDDADRAHAVSIANEPFVRLLIEGPTPLHLIESPTPGTGKGLLVDALTIPAAGSPPAVMTEGRDEDEWRKRITAKLLQGPQFILFDNIRSRLDSAALSAALTSEVWEDRVLGHSRTASLPVTCIWLATANNPSLSLEVARRTVSIRLDAGIERPWERTDFKHRDLRRWVKQHRGELIWAALTLVQAWVTAGKPLAKRIMGSYEHWSEVMGGILEVAGIPGFLGNQDRVYAGADLEVLVWVEFCAAWWDEFAHRRVTADLLFDLARRRRLLLDVWGGRDEHAARTRFGKALARMRDMVIGGFRVRRAGEDTHAKVLPYCLERVEKAAVAAPVAGGSPLPEKSSAGQQSREQRSPSYTGNRGPADEISKEPETPATPRIPRSAGGIPEEDVGEV